MTFLLIDTNKSNLTGKKTLNIVYLVAKAFLSEKDECDFNCPKNGNFKRF